MKFYALAVLAALLWAASLAAYLARWPQGQELGSFASGFLACLAFTGGGSDPELRRAG